MLVSFKMRQARGLPGTFPLAAELADALEHLLAGGLVWHVDPLLCPVCQNPMRVIAVIDDPRAVEKFFRFHHQ